uniref:Protein Flattop n=1 Tax=Amphilophus citrinellus TaxID=61819 RepID=A0A3Q0RBE2_AMPCI
DLSFHFHPQYDGAFKPHRLQNWCETKHFKEVRDVLPRGSAWPDYKGTWNLPAHIPAQRINPTARSVEGLNRLKSWGMYPKHTDMSQPHRGSKSTNRMQVRPTQTYTACKYDTKEVKSNTRHTGETGKLEQETLLCKEMEQVKIMRKI